MKERKEGRKECRKDGRTGGGKEGNKGGRTEGWPVSISTQNEDKISLPSYAVTLTSEFMTLFSIALKASRSLWHEFVYRTGQDRTGQDRTGQGRTGRDSDVCTG